MTVATRTEQRTGWRIGPHPYWNTGDVETDAIVIIGIGSKIWNQDGELMDLPWRQ